MFPVRFPSMICQWNMSWGRECYSQTSGALAILPRLEKRLSEKYPFVLLTICNWRLGLPTFRKMAAAGEKPGREL